VVAVMIGVDPHKASHTAMAINATEEPLGELRVRACAAQAEQLLAWAHSWPERTWAVEGVGGLGHLLAQQLLSAGERVLDVQPKLAARVRLLATGDINKNDPSDARSVAVAALRSRGVREARRDDHAAVLKVWSKRYRDLGRTRTQVACRLHAVLCELVPGGVAGEITAGQPARILASITPSGAVEAARRELAAEFTEDLRGTGRPDPRHQEEAGHRGRRGRHRPDRAVRRRPGDCRRGHRRRPHGVPLPRPGPVRRL
jgi:transposase